MVRVLIDVIIRFSRYRSINRFIVITGEHRGVMNDEDGLGNLHRSFSSSVARRGDAAPFISSRYVGVFSVELVSFESMRRGRG